MFEAWITKKLRCGFMSYWSRGKNLPQRLRSA